jgi:4-hydroxybenzoate polyprenyltransferase
MVSESPHMATQPNGLVACRIVSFLQANTSYSTIDPGCGIWLGRGHGLGCAATICWAIVYDTIYAMQDKEDDRKIGVKSSAILFGSYTWLGVGLASFFMLFFLSLAGKISNLGTEYFLGLMLVAVIMGYQVILLRSEISTELAFKLFKQHCWVGVIVLAGLFLGSL